MTPALNLTIRRRWLDMIASGAKREEYRAPGCAQLRDWARKRLRLLVRDGPGLPLACYRAGYRMDSPAVLVEILAVAPPVAAGCGALAIEAPGFLSEPRHPEWGEPGLPHWTVTLGRVLLAGPYSAVRDYLRGTAP